MQIYKERILAEHISKKLVFGGCLCKGPAWSGRASKRLIFGRLVYKELIFIWHACKGLRFRLHAYKEPFLVGRACKGLRFRLYNYRELEAEPMIGLLRYLLLSTLGSISVRRVIYAELRSRAD